jgi:hypothetical protein
MAFLECNAFRQYGMTANPLAWEVITGWLNEMGVEDRELRLLTIRLVNKLDAEWLNYNAKGNEDNA